MINDLRINSDLYFLFIQINEASDKSRIKEDMITYNKLCTNRYTGKVYYHIRWKKDAMTSLFYFIHKHIKPIQLRMFFYNSKNHKQQIIQCSEILQFTNRGSHYELKIEFPKSINTYLLNSYEKSMKV